MLNIKVGRLAQIIIAAEAATGQSSKPIIKAIIASWFDEAPDQAVEDAAKAYLLAGVDYIFDHPYMATFKTGAAIVITEMLRTAVIQALKGKGRRSSVPVFGLFTVGV